MIEPRYILPWAWRAIGWGLVVASAVFLLPWWVAVDAGVALLADAAWMLGSALGRDE